jgi:MoaA/NifB/PqqE/SkfB family radical SAM enzyme
LTFLESNVSELADMVRLAISLGVDRVKGHHIWAHFDETRELSMRRDSEAIQRWNKAVLDARLVATSQLLQNGTPIVLENFFLLGEAASTDLAPGGPCPFLGNEAWVSSTGRFDPCCAPDAQRRTLGTFGNLHDQGLMEIWNSEAYQGLVCDYNTRALCLGCTMRKPVGGDL